MRKCVGNLACRITNETLTHNELLQKRPIRPTSPLYRPAFASKLLLNAGLSWKQALPSELPALVFVAGESEDRYVKSKELKSWVKTQRSNFASSILAYQCPSAKHELDNEPDEFGGAQVKALSASFLGALLQGAPLGTSAGPCLGF